MLWAKWGDSLVMKRVTNLLLFKTGDCVDFQLSPCPYRKLHPPFSCDEMGFLALPTDLI